MTLMGKKKKKNSVMKAICKLKSAWADFPQRKNVALNNEFSHIYRAKQQCEYHSNTLLRILILTIISVFISGK